MIPGPNPPVESGFPVLPASPPPRVAWEDQASEGRGDIEHGCPPDKPCSKDSEVPESGSSYKQLALDILGACLLSCALLVAPGIFGFFVLAALWKAQFSFALHAFFIIFLLCIMCIPSCTICCYSKSEPRYRALRWLRRRRLVIAVSLLVGAATSVIFFACLYHSDMTIPDLKTDYDARLPVAVIGSGPSGMSASWVLAKGGRNVTVFESLEDIGGHSKSWVEESNGQNLTIDLGFIFNNAAPDAFVSYKDFAQHFNRNLISTSLNTSGYFNGEMWDNTGDPDRFDPSLMDEVQRFLEFAKAPQSTLRYLTPMGLWLWYHGFSQRFRKLCIDSTMAVLFVTKMGLSKQSTQAVLDYFSRDEGFTHLIYDQPKVQFNPGGSQFMWRDVLADMQNTGRAQVRLNSRVTALEKEDGRWTLTLADGSRHGGFGDVILACPANVAADIVRNRPLQSLIVSQISYIDASVTLHTDENATIWPEFQHTSDDVLYFVASNHMTGKIGKIFQDPSSDLLLTVHGQEHEALNIDPARTKWRTTWSHHFFSIFELVVARKLVPMFNNGGGLHYAGDWIYGVGHNDAIKSGVHAACAAGVPPGPLDSSSDPLYSNLLRNTCQLSS